MLTKKQNFLETIKGGNPDRLVNQYEYLALIMDPIGAENRCKEGESLVTNWGYKVKWYEGTPGAFPIHTPEAILLKDVTKWRDVVKPPDPWSYAEERWAPYIAQAEGVDRKEQYVASFMASGLFERLHYLMGMDNALVSFYEEPEATRELIGFIADWEIEFAKVLLKNIKPDALFHHDDWGSQNNSFFSLDLFNEFFAPSYKKLYGFWKESGIELIVHHSDSYAANLVPAMIDIGIDVWQGAVSDNDIPALLEQHGGKISIQGGLDNGKFDTEDWSREKIRKGLEGLVDSCGTKYFIPSLTMGLPSSVYPGVYQTATEEIAALSPRYF